MINELKKRIEHVPPEIIKRSLKGIMWEGSPDSGTMALTFDDGPDPDITPAVLDALEKEKIRGTFFMLGENAAKYPEIASMVVERGHLIGNGLKPIAHDLQGYGVYLGHFSPRHFE